VIIMTSIRALWIIAVGLAVVSILAGGGLIVSLQDEEETASSLIVTLSYSDGKVACIDAGFASDGRLVEHKIKTTRVARGPSWLAVSPDGAASYVVSWDAEALTVVDNAQCTGIRALTFGSSLYAVAFRPDGAAAYIIDAQGKRIIALDTGDLVNPQLITFISLPGARAPRGLTFSPDSRWAYVSDTESDTVWKLDAQSHRLEEVLHTGGQCSAYVKSSNFGRWVYVADRCESRVYAYDVASETFTPIQLSGSSGAWFIAFTPADEAAFVSQTEPRQGFSSGKISVIDVAQKKEVKVIDVSQVAAQMASSFTSGKGLGQGGRFEPAGLDVLSSAGEPLILTVFPFQAVETISMVPFTISLDPELIDEGDTYGISTGLLRPFMGEVFQSSCCEEADHGPIADEVKREPSRGETKGLTLKITVPFRYKFVCREQKKGRCRGIIKLSDFKGQWQKYKENQPAEAIKPDHQRVSSISLIGKKPGIKALGLTLKCNRKCDGKTVEGKAKVTITVVFNDIRKDEHVKGKISFEVKPSGCELSPPSTYEVEVDTGG